MNDDRKITLVQHLERQLDETRLLLIGVRQYVMDHNLGIGECVAWNELKSRFGIGQTREGALAEFQEWEEKKREVLR